MFEQPIMDRTYFDRLSDCSVPHLWKKEKGDGASSYCSTTNKQLVYLHMRNVRLIARLDVGVDCKGIQLEGLRKLSDPNEFINV